ncbi:hypothetical protein GWI33_002060 [Rhynchophorus ferrugineus]|uniref:Uncharacterized protein n=1 Tax=Rhynchophorus ferrugineus TaxID=354439 RepID=A0A834IW41_RHYFE|nr:hypothetical protein GWI33_002060 [Rhynchophorus ferrugineus]
MYPLHLTPTQTDYHQKKSFISFETIPRSHIRKTRALTFIKFDQTNLINNFSGTIVKKRTDTGKKRRVKKSTPHHVTELPNKPRIRDVLRIIEFELEVQPERLIENKCITNENWLEIDRPGHR